MTDTIHATQGSCIRLECVFRDETGAAEDISADQFEIRDAAPASLSTELKVTPLDPAAGRIELFLASESARQLGQGRVNHFRLCRIRSGGCEDNSNLLWIEVS